MIWFEAFLIPGTCPQESEYLTSCGPCPVPDPGSCPYTPGGACPTGLRAPGSLPMH